MFTKLKKSLFATAYCRNAKISVVLMLLAFVLFLVFLATALSIIFGVEQTQFLKIALDVGFYGMISSTLVSFVFLSLREEFIVY